MTTGRVYMWKFSGWFFVGRIGKRIFIKDL